MFLLPTLLGFSACSLPCHKMLHINSGNWDKDGRPPSDHFGQSCSHFSQNEGEWGVRGLFLSPKSLPHHLRGQLPKPLLVTPRKRARILEAHFGRYLADGIIAPGFQQFTAFIQPHFLQILNGREPR